MVFYKLDSNLVYVAGTGRIFKGTGTGGKLYGTGIYSNADTRIFVVLGGWWLSGSK